MDKMVSLEVTRKGHWTGTQDSFLSALDGAAGKRRGLLGVGRMVFPGPYVGDFRRGRACCRANSHVILRSKRQRKPKQQPCAIRTTTLPRTETAPQENL